MSNNNGQVQDIEVMPDFENEMVEETPTQNTGGCGCNKNKTVNAQQNESKTNWKQIGLIVGGLILVYYIFIKKGKVEVPKVEVPEV